MDDGDRLLYLGVGPLTAIALGVALIPLRDFTAASNFTFAFLALTIVVGELGGRGPALATALVSAMSLDFFLTAPFMTLAIHGRDDTIAFVGLALCGLLAASLGSPRRERLAIRRQLGVLQGAVRRGAYSGPAEPRLQEITGAALTAFPLAAIAVRDPADRLLASSGDRARTARVPERVDESEELRAAATRWDWHERGTPLPDDGLRVPLVSAGRKLGWLDLWGDGRAAGPDARRALVAIATALGMLIDAQLRSSEALAAVPRSAPAWTVGPSR